MSTALALLQEKAEQLSPQRQNELIDFAEFLLSKESAQLLGAPAFDRTPEPAEASLPFPNEEQPSPIRGLKFDWCAGLDDPPVEMTAVEMQHEVLEWMAQKAEEHLAKR